MKIVAALREGANKTNARTEAIINALELHGHPVQRIGRHEAPQNADLLIQTGFAPSNALKGQIDANMPYLIMEASPFRELDVHTHSSWGYNGLANGAYRPQAPDQPRWHPTLQELPEDASGTLIIGQKPTDHSLRGTDHVQWILDAKVHHPTADFRPHPLMVVHGTLRPIGEVLREYKHVITFTSTVGVDAMVAGCQVHAKHHGSFAYDIDSRERRAHDLSWVHSSHSEFYDLIPHILSGYDEARSRAECGDIERPRGRVDGQAICERYYRAGL